MRSSGLSSFIHSTNIIGYLLYVRLSARPWGYSVVKETGESRNHKIDVMYQVITVKKAAE